MGPSGGGALPVAQIPEKVETRMVGMKDKHDERARKLEKRVKPFANERHRLDALENLRKWIAKLEQWDEIRLTVRVTPRDLN